MELIGRDAEASHLAELISVGGRRLVSVSGRPGVGKSAFVSIIPSLVPPGGEVWTIDLAGAPAGAELLREAVRELDLAAPSRALKAPIERLAAAIGTRRVVLVADHAESSRIDRHLLEELIRRCPGLTVVVVTLAALGEPAVGLVLGPLRVPPAYARWEEIIAAPSVRLFAARAEPVSPGFRLDAPTARSVAEICRLVGGLPLAIELAAARSRLLSVERLADELRCDRPSDAALDILTSRRGGARIGVRDALLATRALLAPGEDRLFRALAVFRGPFTFDAALSLVDASAGEVLDDLGVLVDLRLVEPAADERHEPTFSMLPLVRSFAREGLDDADLEKRSRFLQSLIRQAASAVQRAAESADIHAVRTMRSDVGDEIRRTAQTDLARAGGIAAAAASVLGGYSESSSITEVLRHVIESGTIAGLTLEDGAGVWLWGSSALAFSPDGAAMRDRVDDWWRRGAELADAAGDPHLALQARFVAVMNGSVTGDLELSSRAVDEGRAIAANSALTAWLARFEVWSAAIAHAQNDVLSAALFALRGLERAERIGDAQAVVGATILLHSLAPGSVSDDLVIPALEDALRLAAQRDDAMGESFALAALADRDLRTGSLASAARWCVRRLTEGRRRGWAHLTEISFVHAALIAAASGDFAFAARMVGAVGADEDRTIRAVASSTRIGYERAKGVIRGRLGPASAARLAAGGAMLTDADAIAEAVRWLEDHTQVEQIVVPRSPGGLTPREQDVLELLALGLTNKGIAERLELSVKTVMHHSVAIYRKLGVRGRAEATATAYRYGLLRVDAQQRGP